MSLIVGIESTAHTFGVGVVKNGEVIVNVKDTYTTKEGGIIPVDAAKHHNELSEEIYLKALEEAKIKEKDIDGIAFSQGPGLAPCLIEGMKFAKKLSERLKKPLIPVNHCVAHLEIGKITGAKDPVMLYASGANTQVIAYAAGKYRVFGETLDVGVGNFIDNFARYAGIGFPGGPVIEKLAKEGKNYVELPYKVKGMDIALSGILTNLKQKIERIKSLQVPSPDHPPQQNKKKNNSDDLENYTVADLAFSLQETVFAMLVETSERALAHTGKKELLLGGGVACNSRLQEMCKIMCEERVGEKVKFFCPPRPLLVDNGAMIAFLGEIIFNSSQGKNSPPSSPGKPTSSKLSGDGKENKNKLGKVIFSYNELDEVDIMPRQRTDDVDVVWK